MWARNLSLTHPDPESHLAAMPKSAILGYCEGGNQPEGNASRRWLQTSRCDPKYDPDREETDW